MSCRLRLTSGKKDDDEVGAGKTSQESLVFLPGDVARLHVVGSGPLVRLRRAGGLLTPSQSSAP